MQWNYDVNRWYDTVKEPWRVIIFITLFLPFAFGVSLYPLESLIYIFVLLFFRVYPRFIKE